MENYKIVIDEVINEYKNEVDNLYPSWSSEDTQRRIQYHVGKGDVIYDEIKKRLRAIDKNMNFDDLKLRQEIINSVNRFRDYCEKSRPAR